MRKYYSHIFKMFFREKILRTRNNKGYTQSNMAELLSMDVRSYEEIEYGNNSCSALTLSLYLIYCCPDAESFLSELKAEFEKEDTDIA